MLDRNNDLFDHWADSIEREEIEKEDVLIIRDIHMFIDERTKESEEGEPPDEDTIVEALDLEGREELVSRAYNMYWENL